MPNTTLIGDDRLWARGHPPGHPLRPERLRDTWEMLHAYDAVSAPNTRAVAPRMPTDEELATFHTPAYIAMVHRLSRGERNIGEGRFGFGAGDNPPFDGMVESEGLKVGAALVGAELLLNDEAEVAFSYSGGLHHGGRALASGFCVFNDCAVAIQRLLDAGLRVAYIDIDAHHGDGTQAAFYEEPRVLTISLHESGRFLFPGTGFPHERGRGAGEGSSVNVPFFPATDDGTFLWAFERVVPPLLNRFDPDVVVAQLGVDAHWRDPLTHLALTTHGLERLFERIHALSPRWLALGGGGYERDVVPRAWMLAWGVMSGQTFPNELPDSIASKYDAPFLHDVEAAPLAEWQRQQARLAAEDVVREVERLWGL